ncbi:transcription factor [Blastocystis sp. subtype 4]|uniref:transcription factor n=1 Tax=Blastocystis sp. subtype 4 TaxID=944170 RepID=UPI0007115C59|nr:transcription factor [Blastocystis sp. subtype 4]KNB43158.1 transcription factor [Blastocystis sp. subtype 4]|eukprot:XP_014526601.1 transcription factor [Blastocystis sp. subtype 4]
MEAIPQEILDARNKLKAKFGDSAASRGKGSSRRTKKVVHKSASTEDAKLKLSLQKVGCQPIDGISEANLFPTDGNVLHFTKCQSLCFWISPSYNTTAIFGKPEEKSVNEFGLKDLMPGIINQLGLGQYLNAANMAKAAEAEQTPAEDDVPDLVENFEDVSKE